MDRESSPITPTPPEPSPTPINQADSGLFSIVTNIAEGKDNRPASIAVIGGMAHRNGAHIPVSPPQGIGKVNPNPRAQTPVLNSGAQLQTFTSLVSILRSAELNRMQRTELGSALIKRDPSVYKRASVSRFKDYISKAEEAGIVRLGPPERGGNVWIILVPSHR